MSETTTPVTVVEPRPSLLKRLPKKKIAITAAAVVVTVAVGALLKSRVDVDVDVTTVEIPSA